MTKVKTEFVYTSLSLYLEFYMCHKKNEVLLFFFVFSNRNVGIVVPFAQPL
jgi:hypothetical protein